ncbi:MAG: hypothetical protein JO031_05335, partial [Ktedonobacteraceae bacterium]|nr:hypothetical protein [Ktedonobacteraceae bacterium]
GRRTLLRWRGSITVDHLDPVIETWDRAFAEVEQGSPAALDLLRLCAFVHHTAIPEEIISMGAAEVVPALQVFAQSSLQQAEAFVVLRRYSLLSQDGDRRTYAMNRIVQEVLKDKMSREEQRLWAERAVVAVTRAFLGHVLLNTVPPEEHSCMRYFFHVHACISHMHEWNIITPEGAQLLYHMGTHLHDYFQAHHESSTLEHERILEALMSYAALLRKMDRLSEADKLAVYADAVRTTHEPIQNACKK